MTTFAILATGPSMSQEVADAAREFDGRIVVNDAYRLAPDADALCAQDGAWWAAHPEAKRFAGRKFSTNGLPGVEKIATTLTPALQRSSNSALLAAHVAIKVFGAKRVLLFGVDCSAARGAHFFGKHCPSLKNTTPERFKIFAGQWRDYAKRLPAGVVIENATPGSALTVFPFYEPCLSAAS